MCGVDPWRTLETVATDCVPQLARVADRISDLPQRVGPRPRTRITLPHRQLDQLPPRDMVEQMVAMSTRLPHVRVRESRMACAASRALCLSDDFAGGPPNAFIDSHEFCHLHPLP